MSKLFKIDKCPYDEGDDIYLKDEILINEGVTILIGCNGSGKSTLIKQFENQLDNENISYYEFDNEYDGGSNSMSAAGFYGHMNLLGNLFMSSEGEKISINLGNAASSIGSYIRKNKNLKEYFIFLDAIDSGFSIDNIINLKEQLFNTIIKDIANQNKHVYIIVSANSYEMANNENCLDVTTCKYMKFDDYEDYVRFILSSREYKDKRYNKGE